MWTMDSLSLAILGIIIGHPAISDFDGEDLAEMDGTFDDASYLRGWRPWGWRPGQCINCCRIMLVEDHDECACCGWLQGEA